MIDTKAIRSKILDLAIRGKLTEQLPEDGTAEELYKQIQSEKQALIKSGKIKKEKPLHEIAEDEIPFEIPDNWKWVRLQELTSNESLNDGNWVLSDDMVDSGPVKLIQLGSIGDLQYKEKGFKYLTKQRFDELNGKQIYPGYLLINRLVADKMLLCIIPNIQGILITAVDVCWIAPQDRHYNIKYLMFALSSSCVQQRVKEVGYGVTRFRISKTNLISIPFPFPPLTEQKRIVEKIEQAFSVLDTIDELQAQYADNLTALKSKLIDLAIQGKLTEQLPEDGTAEELYQQIQSEKQALIKSGKIKKEKPLPEITNDEIPFEIPENWKWVRLSSICYCIFAGGDKPEDFVKEKDEEHQIPVVANGVSNEGIMGYTALATAPSNTLTVAGRGTIGFPCYRDYEYCPVVRLIVIDQSNYIELQYLYYIFLGLPADSVGSSIPQLTVPMVMPKLIPLPPLAEQKRIVDRLDKLLAACDELR